MARPRSSSWSLKVHGFICCAILLINLIIRNITVNSCTASRYLEMSGISRITMSPTEDLHHLQKKTIRSCNYCKTRSWDSNLVFHVEPLQKLSFMQQITFQFSSFFPQKSIFYKKPAYLAERLTPRSDQNQAPASRKQNTISVKSNLSTSRGGFFYRTAALFNNLPDELRCSMEPDKFKKKLKHWIKSNVPIRPGWVSSTQVVE